ncbi:hypothetical protein MKW92_017026 [Papaver armeniacum]|nr:hypothetical protein MKW92_017025 [Papaver armeniacum]KAI3910164.1 hypothetical protein MKW92_017026 [Papaver armeniacum]
MKAEKETVTLDEGKESVVIIGRRKDEAGMKKVEKTEVTTHNPDTLSRWIRTPQKPKSGHGGKYTWEGPRDLVDDELSMGQDVPAAIDEGDPNYVDEEIEEKVETI